MNCCIVEDFMLIVVYLIGWVIMYDNGFCKECKDQLGYNYEEYECGICILLFVDCFQLLIINCVK